MLRESSASPAARLRWRVFLRPPAWLLSRSCLLSACLHTLVLLPPIACAAPSLPTAQSITEEAGERRIDVYAFDCARSRYAHVLSERWRGAVRTERVALAEARWVAALQPMPPKYPVLPIHHARAAACAPAVKRR